MTNFRNDKRGLDRWLAAQSERLVARVADSMDLEAGFQETL